VEESGRGLILRKFSGIRLEGMREATKILSQDARSPGQDFTFTIEL
jgi:hypothetical protein